MELPDFQIPHAEKIEWMIETDGWAIEPVPPRSDTDPPSPAYAYTIGLPALLGFPEVAVFGLPHEKLGEELACAIVLETDQSTTEEAVQSFARERLAGFKVPSKVFIRSSALPRNASNKVLKAALKEQYGS